LIRLVLIILVIFLIIRILVRIGKATDTGTKEPEFFGKRPFRKNGVPKNLGEYVDYEELDKKSS
jgi:hypothetical protein